MAEIPKTEFDISDHPLVKGQVVATGWWTTNKYGNILIKKMTNEHLKRAINYLKRLIRENYNKPEDEYPMKWIRSNLWVLEQMTDELERREEWESREELTEKELVKRVMVQLDVMEVRD